LLEMIYYDLLHSFIRLEIQTLNYKKILEV
jgi:hypothetical protein